jgi:hypothetical protein
LNYKISITAIIFALLSCSTFSVANPGGNGDGNRDFTCGGSCHGDPSLSASSDGVLDIEVQKNVYAGNALAIHVTASDMTLSSNGIIGIFLLGSLNGNSDHPSNYGWSIIQDPNGGSNNYVETTVPSSNSVTLTWILFAPDEGGNYNLYAQMNHGHTSNSDNLAYTGVSGPLTVDVQTTPSNLPGFSENWVAPEYRSPGDSTNIIIMTKNTDSVQVKWKLEGEWFENTANVSLIEKDTWAIDIPPTFGNTVVQYSVITSNGNFSIEQPLLTVGTSLAEFEGSLLEARLQALAFASIIIGFVATLQSYFFKTSRNSTQRPNNTEVIDDKNRLVKHPEHPGWLWDSEKNNWVVDPDNPPNGGVN